MSEKDKILEERNTAIEQADEFIQRIKEDMLKIDERINSFQMKQQGYEQLLIHINSIESAEKETLINIGEGVHVKAEFQKKKTVMVNVGLGFYLESSLEEAKSICEKQINRLELEIQHDIHELAKRNANLTLTKEGKDILLNDFKE